MGASATVDPDPPLRRRKRLPKILYPFAGIAVFLAIVVAAAPWIFSNAALRSEIAGQIRRLSGLATLSQGRAVFVVLPQPHVNIEDVRFAGPADALRIEARQLKVYLRLASLFAGQIEIASLTLDQPKIDIVLDDGLMPPESVIGRAANGALPAADATALDAVRLGKVTLVNGQLRVRTGTSFPDGPVPDLPVEAINMTLDWQRLGAAAILTGTAAINGETAAVAAWIGSPAGLLRGQQSAASVKIDAPAFSFSADGGLAAAPKWQFNGRLRASALSLRTLLERAGYSVSLPGPLDDFGASCDATIESGSSVLSGLRLRFDGNDFEGTLALQTRDKVPVLSGTMATGQLSLRPFLSSLPPASGHDGQWSREPFNLQKTGAADLDLRMSAAHVHFPRFEIEDAAFSLMRNGGRVEFTLAGAKVYRGTAKGRVTVELQENGIGMQAVGVVSGADLAALSFDALGWPGFYGAVTGTANLESTGASMRELMHNLDGLASLDAAQGQVGGIDLDSALRRIDKSPLGLLNGIRRGRTAFDRASLGLRFDKGVASIEDGKLESPNLALAFGGSVDFGERGLDLHAIAMARNATAGPGKESPDFRFDVGGSWDELAFAPDVRGLIRRSGAAAPLFPPQSGAVGRVEPRGDGGQ